MADQAHPVRSPSAAIRPSRRPLAAQPPVRKTRRTVLWILAGAAIALGLVGYLAIGGGETTRYRTAGVDEGSIRVAIAATGKLSALSTVEVGSQVSGQIQSVEVDFNDPVVAGQPIAHIDPANFRSRLEQAQADLTSARANLDAARANHIEAQATLKNAEASFARADAVWERRLISRADYDTALATRDQAQARLASTAAAMKVAESQVAQRGAAVESARLDLDYTVIRAPVDGVVLSRAVQPGQTVAASFQTPVLFSIAEDLGKMQIELTVDESDVGQIRDDQDVRFTVDAFPGRDFRGQVRQVRLAATETSTVITYPVIVDVDNSDGSLLPGMTASAEVLVSERRDVVRLPNAALRYRPPDENASPSAATGQSGAPSAEAIRRMRAQAGQQVQELADRVGLDEAQRERLQAAMSELRQRMMANRQDGRAAQAQSDDARRRRFVEAVKGALQPLRAELDAGQQHRLDEELALMASSRRVQVWALRDGRAEEVPLRIGLADNTHTEVISGLEPGDQVIVGVERND